MHLTMNNYQERLQFLVVELADYEVILGKPWLSQHNPDIGWRRNTLRFKFHNRTVVLWDETYPDCKLLTATAFARAASHPKSTVIVATMSMEPAESP